MKIGIVQAQGKFGDIYQNIQLVEKYLIEAQGHCSHLVIFPELFMTGYALGKGRMMQLAEKMIIDNTLDKLTHLAKQYEMGVVIGYPELVVAKQHHDENTCGVQEQSLLLYNSAVTIDYNGNIVSNYRKTHLYSEYEKDIFTVPTGTSDELFPVFSLSLRNGEQLSMGVLICYDIEFPEPSRILALKGAKLIAVPTANMDVPAAKILVSARALENHIYVVYSNRMGLEENYNFCGLSGIVAPDGQYIAKAEQESEMVFGEIDHASYENYIEGSPYLKDRLPALYRDIHFLESELNY